VNTDPGTPDELADAAAGGITGAPASQIVNDSVGTVIGDHATVNQHFVLPLEPLAWPIRVGIPPKPAAAFQERPGLRSAVEEPLAENGAVTVVVAGNGGTGKTQLAAAVFAGSGHAGFDLRLWISATSRNELLTAYAEAAGAVSLFHLVVSRVCRTWMALARWPACQGQQRSLRRMCQVLSWALARSPGARC
jgi:hypothetical protein